MEKLFHSCIANREIHHINNHIIYRIICSQCFRSQRSLNAVQVTNDITYDEAEGNEKPRQSNSLSKWHILKIDIKIQGKQQYNCWPPDFFSFTTNFEFI